MVRSITIDEALWLGSALNEFVEIHGWRELVVEFSFPHYVTIQYTSRGGKQYGDFITTEAIRSRSLHAIGREINWSAPHTYGRLMRQHVPEFNHP